MPFTSISFLFYFLPAALALHRFTLFRKKPGYQTLTRITVFLLTLFFLAAKSQRAVIPFLICVTLDFFWAILLARSTEQSTRKLTLCLAIAQNILLLGLFKYTKIFGGGVLPLGISFYTLESLSFIIDLYRREVKTPENRLELLASIGMFPRFIAGPVVRYKELSTQIQNYRGMHLEQGLFLFSIGLFWKVCFADHFALFTQYAFDSRPFIESVSAWVGAAAFTFQIYFDLAGYSLMAIGLGRCLGFQFPTNFNKPFEAASFTEFWQRWNITITNWFRDYIYFPLGGNQASPARHSFNILVTVMVASLWYSEGSGFLVWGLFHATFLIAEKNFPDFKNNIPYPIGRTLTLLLVMVGWIFFKADTFGQAKQILTAMGRIAADFGYFNSTAFQMFPLATLFCVVGIIYVFFIEPHIKMTNLEAIAKVKWGHRFLGLILFSASLLMVASPSGTKTKHNESTRWLEQAGNLIQYLAGRESPEIDRGPSFPNQYLFLRESNDTLYQYPGQALVTKIEAPLTKWVETLTKAGIETVILPIPSKQSLDREILPVELEDRNIWKYVPPHQRETIRANYLSVLGIAPQHSVDLFDLYQKHMQLVPDHYLYVPWDIHWTTEGIAVAAQGILGHLKKKGEAVELYPLRDMGLAPLDHSAPLLSSLGLPSYYLRRAPQFQWRESLVTLDHLPEGKPVQGRLIVVGSSFCARHSGTQYNLGDQLSKALGRELTMFCAPSTDMEAGAKKMLEQKFSLKKGDIVVYEFLFSHIPQSSLELPIPQFE
jgi:alginate O-acetyltransferase complex protein AlgI